MTRDGQLVNSIAPTVFDGVRFAFGFSDDGHKSEPELKRSRPVEKRRPADIPIGLLAYTRTGKFARIDWERSSSTQVFAAGQYHDPEDLELVDEPACVYNPDLWLVDAIFDVRLKSFPDPQLMHYTSTPLTFEPGLPALCWPLTSAAFRQHVYNRRAWVVHSARHRLHHLAAELAQFDIDTLIETATRTVAWLRDAADGAMQYVDVDQAALARAMYRAGHSLYFNPDLDLQRRYVEAIAADLGLDFAAGATGGFGGDIEMFAVRGAHRTPWHYDAQHNFTIQLTGTKRWSIKRGPIRDPISNLHPRSSNRDAVLDDRRVHGATTPDPVRIPGDDDADVYEFTLRPGSVLYLPAGWWHRVEQLDDATPSLSMNFSIDGSRWVDLLANRLMPLLWADPRWRERPDFNDGLESARYFYYMSRVFIIPLIG